MEKIIIDCDPGIDDFAAILFAVKSQKFKILGLSTVDGNCSVENATLNALKTLQIAGNKNIPVYKGAEKSLKIKDVDATEVHGNNGFGDVRLKMPERQPEKEYAVDFLIKTVSKNPGEITLVALGALTNIALAIEKDENFVKNVKNLVLMGGSEGKGNVTPTAEFNFYKDPDAAKIVFEAGFENLVMIGLDVTSKIVLYEKLERFLLEKEADEIAQFWYRISRQGAAFDREVAGEKGLLIHDTATIGYLINDDLIKTKDAYVEISLKEENLGQSIVDNNYKEHGKEPNCKVAYEIKDIEFLKILFKTIFKDAEEEIDKILS